MNMLNVALPKGRLGERVYAMFEKAGFELEESGIYFDVVDDDVFAEFDKSSLLRGEISMGKALYDTIIIPPCRFVPDEVKVTLASFVKGGGKLYTVGELGIDRKSVV